MPLSQDIKRKIKQIEIHTKRLLNGALIGDSRSALKGTGFEFDQIREYQMGDDVRFIDWKATARSNKFLVKEYMEERSRVIVLAVDISGSSFFSSTDELKHDLMAQIASVLALVADYGNDYVGLLLFSDIVELFIPPRRGKFHTHAIMQSLFGYKPTHTGTDFMSVLKRLAQLKRNDVVVFLISDFIGPYVTSYWSIIAKKYDVIAIRCLDKNELAFPAVGFITVEDIETGQQITMDMRRRNEKKIASFLTARTQKQDKIFKKYGIDVLNIASNRPFVGDLIRFFRQRMRY